MGSLDGVLTWVAFEVFLLFTIETVMFLILTGRLLLRYRKLLTLSNNLGQDIKNLFGGNLDMTETTTYSEVKDHLPDLQNTRSIEEMLGAKAEDKDYELFFEILIPVVQQMYREFRFTRQDPIKDDYTTGYNFAFYLSQQAWADDLGFLFRLFIDRGLDSLEINKRFGKKVSEGAVIPLGEGLTVNMSETGMSPISQGGEITVLITIMPEDFKVKYDEIAEQAKELQEQAKEQKEQELQEALKLRDVRLAAYEAMRNATKVLEELTKKNIEKNDLQIELEAQLTEMKKVDREVL